MTERTHHLRLVRTPEAADVQQDLQVAVELGDLSESTAVFALNAYKRARGLPLYHGPELTRPTPPEPPDIVA